MKRKRLRNIVYAVPTTDMYKTSAHQLSADEVEQVADFFSKVKEHNLYLKEETNPIEIPKTEIMKIPPGNPNVKSFEGALVLRSCFYNSKSYSLEEKTGIFASQALHFKDKESYETFTEAALKSYGSDVTPPYAIFFGKGNVNAVINMYMPNTEPTKEFYELAEFVKDKGFKILKERGINKK